MYRNYKMGNHQSCSCKQDKDKSPVLEDICDDVLSISDYTLDDCACGFDEDQSLFPSNPMFGQSYVPNQVLNTTFMPEVALKVGTLFPELVSPYMPGQSMAEIDYLRKTNTIKEGCNRA